MVSRAVLALAAALCLGAALPQGPAAAAADWTRAGGGLFADGPGPASDAGARAAEPPGADARLPAPRQPFEAAVAEAAARHGLDPKLLHALVAVESAYRPTAVSPAGAAGLTQLMPGAARETGVEDRFDPAANLRGGADYLTRQLRRFGDLRLALAAYNAGPARVARDGRVPAIPETRRYVEAVIQCYLTLTAGRGVRGAGDCRAVEAQP